MIKKFLPDELYKNKSAFFKYFLDENLLALSEELMQQKRWIVMPVPDPLEFRETEWLSNAIHSLNLDSYISYSFEYNDKVTCARYKNTQENLWNSDNVECWKYLIITNDNLDFLYYRNPDYEYHLFAGSADFVYKCVQCSKDVCKQIFLNEFIMSYEKGTEVMKPEDYGEYEYFLRLWSLLSRESTT